MNSASEKGELNTFDSPTWKNRRQAKYIITSAKHELNFVDNYTDLKNEKY